MNNQFFANALQGLGQGLMAAGGSGWNQFAPAFSQGLMNAQNMQLDRMDREERQRLRALQEEQLRMQVEQQRTQNQDAVAMRQKYEKLLGQGMMSPNGMSQAQFGGAPQNQMAPGLMQQFSPEQLEILKTLPPEQGLGIAAQKMFADPKEQKLPSEVQEYEYAKSQGYNGTFYDYQKDLKRAGATTTNVNMGSTGIDYGDPETGLAWVRNPDGTVKLDERGAPMAVPYQGSKAYLTAQAGDAAAENRAETAQKTADIVTNEIDRVFKRMEDATLPVSGFGAETAAGIAGTAASDVKALIDTVKANIGFGELQKMREASPTGGALGQVTLPEIEFLQSVAGNLTQSQSETQLKENLARLEEAYLDVIHGPGNRPPGWKKRDIGTKRLKYNPETGELE